MCPTPPSDEVPTQDLLVLSNRRCDQRAAVRTSVAFFQEGSGVARAHLLNLSQTGARLILAGVPGNPQPLLSLFLGDQHIQARIVWEQELDHARCRVAGVCFENLNGRQWDALLSLPGGQL